MQKVIFRMINGEVLAILPGLPANFGNVVIYAHNGQHGEADSDISRRGRLATPEEYAPLHAELQRQGYDNLTIRKRVQRSDLLASWERVQV